MLMTRKIIFAAFLISVVSRVLTAPIALAESAIVPLSNGRYEFQFGGYRFALTDYGDYFKPYIGLCIPGMPDMWPRGREWDDRTDWPLDKILREPESFARNLAQAKSIYIGQSIPSTGSAEDASLLHKPVKNVATLLDIADAKMFVDIDASTINDHPCYDHGERAKRTSDSQVDEAQRAFEEFDHDKDRFEKIGPLYFYRGIYNNDNAYGKIDANDRSFISVNPLYVWCSWPDCRRLSRSDDYKVVTNFVFASQPNTIDPGRWPSLDRFFHEYTIDFFQGTPPKGIE